uniref:Transmembrane protein n=1 Tax=Neospora caninum (strain Liverpool) TaxID=572307 RepID=A0A0F7UM49_NEOCL|nr:TPA: hypothetical protein BN1204_049960 [Neospora caninum Liverpool]
MVFHRKSKSVFFVQVLCTVAAIHVQDATADTLTDHMLPDAGHESESFRNAHDESVEASDRISALIRHAISNLWPVLFRSWPKREEANFDHGVQQETELEARRLATEQHEPPEVSAAGVEWAVTSCYRRPDSTGGHRGDDGIADLIAGGPGQSLLSRKAVLSLANVAGTTQKPTPQWLVSDRIDTGYMQYGYKTAAALDASGALGSHANLETRVVEEAVVPEDDMDITQMITAAFLEYKSDWQEFSHYLWSRFLGHSKYILALRSAEVLESANLARPAKDLVESEHFNRGEAERLAVCIALEGCLGDSPTAIMMRASRCVDALGITAYHAMPSVLKQDDRATLHKLFIDAYAELLMALEAILEIPVGERFQQGLYEQQLEDRLRAVDTSAGSRSSLEAATMQSMSYCDATARTRRQELALFLLTNARMVADANKLRLPSTTITALQELAVDGKTASNTLLNLVLGELQTTCASAIARGDHGINLIKRCVTDFINEMPSPLSKAFCADKVDTLARILQSGAEIQKPTNSYLQQVDHIATKTSDILKDLAMQEARSFRFLLPFGYNTPRVAELVDMPRDQLVAVAEAFALSQYAEEADMQKLTVASNNASSGGASEQSHTPLATVSLVLESVRIVDAQTPPEVDLNQRFRILSERTGLSSRTILAVQSYRTALGIFQAVHSNMRDPLATNRIETVNMLDEFIIKSVRRETGEMLAEAEDQDGRVKQTKSGGPQPTPTTLYIQISSQVSRTVKYLFASELVSELKSAHQKMQNGLSLPDVLRKHTRRKNKDFRLELPMMFMVDSMYGCARQMASVILNDKSVQPTCQLTRGTPTAIADCVSPSEELAKAMLREPKLLQIRAPHWLSANGVAEECRLMERLLDEGVAGGDFKFLVMSELEKYDCGKDPLNRDYWARYALKTEMLRDLYQRYAVEETTPTVEDFILNMFGINVKEFERSKKVEVRSSKLLIQRTFQKVIRDRPYLAQCRQDEATFLNELGLSLRHILSQITREETGELPRQGTEQLISIIQPVIENASLERDVAVELKGHPDAEFRLPFYFPSRTAEVSERLPDVAFQMATQLEKRTCVNAQRKGRLLAGALRDSTQWLHRAHEAATGRIAFDTSSSVPRTTFKTTIEPFAYALLPKHQHLIDCVRVVKLYHNYIEQSGDVKDVDTLYEQARRQNVFAQTFESLGLPWSSRNLQQFRFALCITCAKYLPSIMLEKLETGTSPAAASFDQSSDFCRELYRRQGWTRSPVTTSIQLNLSLDHMAHRIISRLLRAISASESQGVARLRVIALCSGAATISLAYQDIESAIFEGSRRSDGALLRQWSVTKKPNRYKVKKVTDIFYCQSLDLSNTPQSPLSVAGALHVFASTRLPSEDYAAVVRRKLKDDDISLGSFCQALRVLNFLKEITAQRAVLHRGLATWHALLPSTTDRQILAIHDTVRGKSYPLTSLLCLPEPPEQDTQNLLKVLDPRAWAEQLIGRSAEGDVKVTE